MKAVSVLAAVLALMSVGAAVAEERPLASFFHQSWGIRQGAPGSAVSIAQTTDGYLWVATPAGLYRFDGVRFDRYDPISGRIPRRIVKLRSDDSGGLWIGSSSEGVTFLKFDAAVTYGPSLGMPTGTLWDLALDAAGGVMAATENGLSRFEGGRWNRIGPASQLPPGAVRAVLTSRTGAIWLGTASGLFWLPPGAKQFQPTATTTAVFGLAEAPDGTIWISEQRGGTRPAATGNGEPVNGAAIPHRSRTLLFDRAGALWLASDSGLVRARSQGVEVFRAADGLTNDSTFAVFEDHEGNIWAGTSAGLDFFRETALTGAPLPPRTHAMRLAAGPDDALWVGSQNQPLMRIRSGVVSTFAIPPPVTGVHVDPSGNTWAWGNGRLWRIAPDDRVTQLPELPEEAPADAWSIGTDAAGRVWVVRSSGLYIYDGRGWSRPTHAEITSRSGYRMAFTDDTRRLWLSHGDGVSVVDGDSVVTFSAADGLRTGRISGLASGRQRVWLAGDEGLCVFDGRRMRTIPGIDADTVGRITGIAEAADGSVWLNAARGVVRIPALEVQQAIERSSAPAFRVFDYLDGVIGGAAPIPPQSAMRTTDGRLWFVGFDNLVSIDPSAIPSNAVPPPVHIQAIASGGTSYSPSDGLRLPVRTSNLQIKYTGLSLSMPDRVRFRYRLDGADADWHDAGTRREAFYTNLSPGQYRFQVIAANNDGVWNETGATLAFVVPPAFYQTTWFRTLVILSAAASAWLLHRRRVQQLAAQMHERLEERLAERERIARELHDTLLQGVQGLILRFQAAASRIPPGDPASTLMEDALTRADTVLVEGRDRIQGLRGVTGGADDLPGALMRAGEELALDSSATLRVAVEGRPAALHPVIRDEVYWIAREALANAFRHGEAEHVEVEIVFGSRELRVRLRDDGRGLEPDVMKAGGRALHWGLPGMRERAARVGAQLDLRSSPETGTEIELRVAAEIAYAKAVPAGRPKSWSRTADRLLDHHG